MNPANHQKKIEEKLGHLAELISNQEEITIYKQAEEKIKNNKRIQHLITEIKIKQQELVNAKHYKKTNYIKKLELELEQLNDELHNIPLVKQYQQTQMELNRYLKSIMDLIKHEIEEKIPLEENE